MFQVAKKEIMVSASVSCMDMMHFKESMQQAEEAGIDFYHFDIVDGAFNQCFILGQTLLEAMRPQTKLPIEVHLAVYNPEKYIRQFINSGGDYIGVHMEAMENPEQTLDKIIEYGALPVLCFRAETSFNDAALPLLNRVAWVNKLTVNPGFSGQKIQMPAIEHIRCIRRALEKQGLDLPIQADGNINADTIPYVVKAGANILTGGTSGLFLKGKPVKENIASMKEAAKKAKE